MRADNSPHLAAAAARRSRQAKERAETTLQQMIRDDQPVTVAALCRQARVSRSWVYTQPALINAIANRRSSLPATPPPAAASATEASLLQRLRLAHERNRSLSAEVQNLRDQLAILYGELRSVKLTVPPGSSPP